MVIRLGNFSVSGVHDIKKTSPKAKKLKKFSEKNFLQLNIKMNFYVLLNKRKNDSEMSERVHIT